jgi:ABC-type lipoprotein export system ATPase subunit
VRFAARDLTFGYESSPPVVSDWTEEFLPGEVVAITGPSGRGKSTLLYLLGLMLEPSAGDVLIDGAPSSRMKDSERAQLRARYFGFVFQDAALDSTRSVLDNVLEVALYAQVSREGMIERAHYLLDRFGVESRSHARPGQISGGQAQRIALCRALLNDPRVVLADEPTGNLDALSSGVVIDALRSQASGGAVVIIATHDPRVVSQCDREIRL